MRRHGAVATRSLQKRGTERRQAEARAQALFIDEAKPETVYGLTTWPLWIHALHEPQSSSQLAPYPLGWETSA